MQEITPTAATQPHPFPTGAIVKEAWRISTTYFWPLTMAIFVIQIPEKIMVSLANDNQAWKISLWYEALVSGFVFVGVYRAIYRLRSDGFTPTFSGIYKEGQPFYGRNFRLVLSFNIYSALILIGVALLVIPCFMLLRDSTNQPWSFILLAISCIIGAFIIAWWTTRIFIYRAALSDDSPGATKAIEYALRLTKGNALRLFPLILCMLGILTVIVGFHIANYVLMAGGLENEMSKATEINANLISAIPFAFAETLGIAMAALAYLRLKEESQLVSPSAISAGPETPLS